MNRLKAIRLIEKILRENRYFVDNWILIDWPENLVDSIYDLADVRDWLKEKGRTIQ